jgi:hypothetical protein
VGASAPALYLEVKVPDIDPFDPGKKTGDCIPLFHYEQRVDQEASEEAGHNIFKDVEYVEIIAPGNDKEIVNRAVTPRDIDRWPTQYAAFKNKEKVQYEGTPVEQWPQVTAAQAKTLLAMKIFTVEQLADVADQNISTLGMGMMDLKNKAKAWLDWQNGESSVQKYAQQNRRLSEQNKSLTDRIEQLEERMAALLESKDEVAPAEAPKKSQRKARGSAK